MKGRLESSKRQSLPLEGIRIASLEHSVGAPLGTRLLADLGAEVIKIERPGRGDFARYWDSAVNGLSSYFVWLNRNKKSVTLNLKSNEGRKVLDRILRRSDVFVQNLGPGSAQRLGFGPEAVCKRYPKLVYCAVSGYGQNGPYRDAKAYDLLIQGESGLVSLTGSEDSPAKAGISVADIASGLYAAAAILSALNRRARTGAGCFIDISMFDCMLDLVAGPALYFLHTGIRPRREGMRHNLIVPYGPFVASDHKYVSYAVENEEEWKVFCTRVIDRPDLLEDPRFSSNEGRLSNRRILEPIIESIFLSRGSEEWMSLLAKADIAFGRVNELKEVLSHPQARHRRLVQKVATEKGLVSTISNPIKMQNLRLPMKSVPRLGQDTKQELKELGYSPSQIKKLILNHTV